ncbi:MAG: permease [Pleomorphochaeta sp.]
MQAIIFYSVAFILLIYLAIKDIKLAKTVIKKSIKGFLNLLPQMSFIMVLMGISLSILTVETISSLIGENSGFFGYLIAIGVGGVSLIPSFITIPLGATLVANGAGLSQAAGFISALMGIGVVTFPMEKKYFGTKFALTRNIGCLFMTILFVVVIHFTLGSN